MKKLMVWVVAGGTFWSSCAFAENWVVTQPNLHGMTAMYDADSAYVRVSDHLIYSLTCMDQACTLKSRNELFGPQLIRVNCVARSFSNLDNGRWGVPSYPSKHPYSFKTNEYDPESSAGLQVSALCAHKTSWPRR